MSFQEDDSLRRWKEKLLGSLDLASIGGLALSLSHSSLFVDQSIPTSPFSHFLYSPIYLVSLLPLWRYLFLSHQSFKLMFMFILSEKLEPEVKILRLTIISTGRPDTVLFPSSISSTKGSWFTLKEGSNYRLKFSFTVSHNIVSGLRYSNSVWKAGVKGTSLALINIYILLYFFVRGLSAYEFSG